MSSPPGADSSGYFIGALMHGVEPVGVQISGEIDQPTINRVHVAHLMNAELDRRIPDRSRQSASVAVSGQGS